MEAGRARLQLLAQLRRLVVLDLLCLALLGFHQDELEHAQHPEDANETRQTRPDPSRLAKPERMRGRVGGEGGIQAGGEEGAVKMAAWLG